MTAHHPAGLTVHDTRGPAPTEDGVGVALCQLAPVIGEPTRNRQRLADAVRLAAGRGARLVVLPELAASGYVFRDVDEAWAAAERPDGPTVRVLTEVAGETGVVAVAGFAEAGEDGALYNSAALVDADGLRAVYRKAHLWDRETELFTAGSAPPAVVDTAVGRVGVIVCYDLEFPEWVRLAALDGAEIVCAPSNCPAEPRPESERPIEIVRAQAMASMNRVWVAVCDRTGTERGVEWVGATTLVAPDGFPVASSRHRGGEQVVIGEARPRESRDKAVSPRNDALADRRPSLYRRVGDPMPRG